MTKSDLIKFRCEPEFKAALVREATYRGVDLSMLVREALEPLTRPTGFAFTANAVESRPTLEGIDRVLRAFAQIAPPSSADGDGATVPVHGTCTHGRPRAACWECA